MKIFIPHQQRHHHVVIASERERENYNQLSFILLFALLSIFILEQQRQLRGSYQIKWLTLILNLRTVEWEIDLKLEQSGKWNIFIQIY